MTVAYERREPWTLDEVLALPEDGNRYELIDGNLIVSPPPSVVHQFSSGRLFRLIADAAERSGAKVLVAEAIGIVHEDELLIPDIVVIRSSPSLMRQTTVSAAEVELAVEIVSPRSRARDRGEKPYVYAEAGIPYFWRVETMNYRSRTKELPVVITHELVGIAEYGVRQIVGAGERFRVGEPFPVEFDPAALVELR